MVCQLIYAICHCKGVKQTLQFNGATFRISTPVTADFRRLPAAHYWDEL
ncbi:hypothetical protein OAY06_00120 [bacterium]|nr:hypothetical protein [bacterium]